MLQGMSRAAEPTTWALTRAAGIQINPTLVTQRANGFATKAAAFDTTVLLLRRDEDTMRGYLITTGHGGDSMRAATDLAQTVGARAVESELPEDLDVDNVVGWLVYQSGSAVAREAQVNSDPSATAQILANTIPPGSWVAVTLRKPTKKERARNGRWLSHRLSTAVPNHHSLSPDAVVVSIFAGGEDANSVRSLLEGTRSAMPGFDVVTRAKVATRLSTILVPALIGLALAGVGVGSAFAGVDALTWPSVGAGLFALLVGVGRFVGLLPSAYKRTQAMARTCRFAAPKKRFGRPKSPHPERTVRTRDGMSKTVEARDGDYPLHKSAFQVGPQVVVGVVAPQAGAVSGESQTRTRAVPPVMLKRIGPLVGDSEQGPAYLSAWDHEGQTAIAGRAGSGKSVLTRSLFGWSSLERMQPSGLRGFPGRNNALVAFESKGDGVAHYEAWATATGDNMKVIDIADPNTLGIDVFAIPGTVFDKANFFVNALKYAFGEQAIGDRSFETLLSVLPAALLVTPQTAAAVPDLATNGSPVYYTHVLLGGRGDDMGRALAAELAGESVRPDADPIVREAVVGMGPLYGPNVTPAQRRTLQEAPRNKMRQLIELENWWTPSRRKVGWSLILDKHRAVVINTGTSIATGTMVEDTLNAQMSAILMYSLRHAIQRTCSGWQEQGRYVSIFADELSLLAGSSEAVIAWLKDQGRSFGVRSFLATQRPEQLPEKVRKAFLNFSTFISFTQEDMTTAREIAEAVSGEEGEWVGSDILQLNTYTAVVRSHVDKKRQPAFTVKVRNFEGDRSQFSVDQGYTTGDPIAEASTFPVLPDLLPPTGPAEAPVLADPAPVKVIVEPDPVDDDDEPINLSDW